MIIDIPNKATQYGFVNEGLGSHSSRTMMLSELKLLLQACPIESDLGSYQAAIVVENVLLKETEATRAKSFRHLREIYGLSPNVGIFRALRELWNLAEDARPMLALFCAAARDPSLRATIDIILSTQPGDPVTPQMLAQEATVNFPELKASTLNKIGRNTASSWTQSGHLKGRTGKVRATASSHPASVTYALFLGYLCGDRGEALFHTYWAKLLDASQFALQEKAIAASRFGWLEYRHAGNVTDVTFRHLLREKS